MAAVRCGRVKTEKWPYRHTTVWESKTRDNTTDGRLEISLKCGNSKLFPWNYFGQLYKYHVSYS